MYTAPFIWVTDVKIDQKNGKNTTYDKFKVKSIEYTDGSITSLEIVNAKTGKTVYTTKGNNSKPKQEKAKESENKTQEQAENELVNMKINKIKIDSLKDKCKADGVNLEKVCEMCKVKTPADLTEKLYSNIVTHWDDVKAKASV